jgi:hypothetical protein
MDLTEFITQRLDEDESVARRADEPPFDVWCYDEGDDGEVYHAETRRRNPDMEHPNGVTCDTEGLSPAVDESRGPHIARHDPARVLAQVEAMRRIVALYRSRAEQDHPIVQAHATGLGLALRALATIWHEHPDFDPAWAD